MLTNHNEIRETPEYVFTPTGEPDQLWVMSKASGETYRVDLKDFVCSCPDFKFRQVKGERMCKHLKAACEAYGIEARPSPPAQVEQGVPAITIDQEEVIKEISRELRDEMVRRYVYSVPDYTDNRGRRKRGWIDLRAGGAEDLAHMIADRYGQIELGEFRFMDAGTRWVAWRDIRLGNFTATGFADSSKEREFPFRYLGKVVMRNCYKAVVPKIYQDLFTNKFRELMRQQLKELLSPEEQKRLGKPIEELSDGELARALKDAEEEKKLPGAKSKPEAAKGAESKTSPDGVKPEDVLTLNNLFGLCHRFWGMQPKEVVEELGYASRSEIRESPWNCWLKIKALKEERPQEESKEQGPLDWQIRQFWEDCRHYGYQKLDVLRLLKLKDEQEFMKWLKHGHDLDEVFEIVLKAAQKKGQILLL